MINKNINQQRNNLEISIWLNIALIFVVVVGLFYVFLNAPTRYFVGSLFSRPQTLMIEDVKTGAFTVEYLNAFETKEVKLGSDDINIGEFNINSSYEPIEVHSLNFIFENSAKSLINNLRLFIQDDEYNDVEFLWIDDANLSLIFSSGPLLVENKLNIKINADLSENDQKGTEIVMHFSFADLTGKSTNQFITNQGIINEDPDAKPLSIIIN